MIVVNTLYAQLSDLLVYATMTTLTLAMVLFAIALAKGRQLESVAAPSSASFQVRMGATATLEQAAVTTAVVGQEGRRSGNIGMALTWLSALLLGTSLVLRGLSAQRLPWGNMYEFSLAGGFSVLVA